MHCSKVSEEGEAERKEREGRRWADLRNREARMKTETEWGTRGGERCWDENTEKWHLNKCILMSLMMAPKQLWYRHNTELDTAAFMCWPSLKRLLCGHIHILNDSHSLSLPQIYTQEMLSFRMNVWTSQMANHMTICSNNVSMTSGQLQVSCPNTEKPEPPNWMWQCKGTFNPKLKTHFHPTYLMTSKNIFSMITK